MQILNGYQKKLMDVKNNPENSSTTKISEHIRSGFSMYTTSPFRSIQNKHDVYRGKYCMEKFCVSLREHAMQIINFKNKKRSQKSSKNHLKMQKICYLCQERFAFTR